MRIKHKKLPYKSIIRYFVTYFNFTEAPLCRIEFQLITTSHGNGISPKLSKNLHKVRRVGTLPTALSQKPSQKIESLPTRRSKYKSKKLNREKVARIRRRGASFVFK